MVCSSCGNNEALYCAKCFHGSKGHTTAFVGTQQTANNKLGVFMLNGDIEKVEKWLNVDSNTTVGLAWSRIKKALVEGQNQPPKCATSRRAPFCPWCKSKLFMDDDTSGCCTNVPCDFEWAAKQN